MAHRTGFSFGE